MTEEYYVIVDLDTLQYQKEGEGVNLREADKFYTLEEAKEELKTYDETIIFAIYKVKEHRKITIEKVR